MNKSDFYALLSKHFSAPVSDDIDIADLPSYSSVTVFTLLDVLEQKGVKTTIDVVLDAETASELYDAIFG